MQRYILRTLATLCCVVTAYAATAAEAPKITDINGSWKMDAEKADIIAKGILANIVKANPGIPAEQTALIEASIVQDIKNSASAPAFTIRSGKEAGVVELVAKDPEGNESVNALTVKSSKDKTFVVVDAEDEESTITIVDKDHFSVTSASPAGDVTFYFAREKAK